MVLACLIAMMVLQVNGIEVPSLAWIAWGIGAALRLVAVLPEPRRFD